MKAWPLPWLPVSGLYWVSTSVRAGFVRTMVTVLVMVMVVTDDTGDDAASY